MCMTTHLPCRVSFSVEHTPSQRRRWMGRTPYYSNFQIRATCPRSAVGWRNRSFSHSSALHATAIFRLYWNNASKKKQKNYCYYIIVTIIVIIHFKKIIISFMCTYQSQKNFLCSILASYELTRQIFYLHKVPDTVIAWILHVQYVDVFLLFVTDKPQRKNLFILDPIHVDRHHVQTFKSGNVF